MTTERDTIEAARAAFEDILDVAPLPPEWLSATGRVQRLQRMDRQRDPVLVLLGVAALVLIIIGSLGAVSAFLRSDSSGVATPAEVTTETSAAPEAVAPATSVALPTSVLATDATESFSYDTDRDRFAALLLPAYGDQTEGITEDVFLGGGVVLGEPWAIVGTQHVVPGKRTVSCIGVRPILNEDVCDSGDYLYSQVLPVGAGGVLVFHTSLDATRVLVSFGDGRVVDVPVLGTTDGYPPIAVIPVERIGEAGTALTTNDSGDVLNATAFSVSEFAVPQG